MVIQENVSAIKKDLEIAEIKLNEANIAFNNIKKQYDYLMGLLKETSNREALLLEENSNLKISVQKYQKYLIVIGAILLGIIVFLVYKRG